MVGGVALAGSPGRGQTHKIAKQEPVVRAVGVYEWTGDMAKPTASRLIPVSLLIDGKLQDAGVYLGRPIPFALLPGNVYELQDAGVAKGSLDLVYAKHLQAVDEKTGGSEYDDGWFGYGTYMAPVPPKKRPALKPSKTLPVIASSGDSDKPKFATKSDSGANDSAGSTQAADPDRPTMQRRTSGSSGTSSAGTAQGDSTGNAGATQGSGSVPADDPDRPTMKRRSSDSSGSSDGTTTDTNSGTAAGSGNGGSGNGGSGSAGSANAGSGSVPSEDPDRPTLKRHSPEEAKKVQQAESVGATVSGTSAALNDDPDRPNLHHGKPANAMTETDLPKLAGLPPNLHQMVAVSDAANRDQHEFMRSWVDDAEKAAILQKMQVMAQAELAAYGGATAGAVSSAKQGTTSKTPTASKTAAAAGKARRMAGPAPIALMDETLKGYTLSYGGDPTYIYMAHTDGTGAALRYVTVVAEADAMGELKVAMKSVTDAAHLDRTPEMKFVDVVDAEASNRASLLFELRGQNSRQFALYRLIAANSEQIFLSGTTQ
jgi:hypothetical protein